MPSIFRMRGETPERPLAQDVKINYIAEMLVLEALGHNILEHCVQATPTTPH